MPGMLEIRFGFLFLATIAFLFGPIVGFAAGFLTNMLGFLLFSGAGAFNPLFDLNVGLMGVFYAVFLYRRNPKSEYFIIWIVLAQAAVNVVCRIIINTYLLILIGFIPAEGEVFITTIRLFRNITLMPLEIVMLLAVLKFTATYAVKFNFVKLPDHTKKPVKLKIKSEKKEVREN
jgi:ECF transporter S component (folate family)